MKWASAICEGDNITTALEQCCDVLKENLGSDSPSLIFAFVSAAYAAEFDQVTRLMGSRFPEAMIIGCSAAGVIGSGLELEGRPAVAITAGHLPDVQVAKFWCAASDLPTPDDPPEAWVRLVGVPPEARPSFLILMSPTFARSEELLAGLDFAFPDSTKVGGVASGGQMPGSQVLYLANETYRDGAVGVVLTGDIAMDTIVAQGCRPIGDSKHITKCHQNILLELDARPPIAYLQEIYPKLSTRDQELLSGSLFLGIAVDPLLSLQEMNPGDFLVRNVIGADQERGILAIGERLREGQLVQFHVRDATTSAEDLQRQLSIYLERAGKDSPRGALLFQCNGRGMHLYGMPNHDTNLFMERAGPVPLGGFFCNGEIGPVRGTTYLHGYTSSFAIFRKP